MRSIPVLTALVSLAASQVFALPAPQLGPRQKSKSAAAALAQLKQSQAQTGGGQAAAASTQIPPIGSGPATAPDGSTIIEDQVTVNGLPMRFKLSGPASAFKAGTQTGAQAQKAGVAVVNDAQAGTAGGVNAAGSAAKVAKAATSDATTKAASRTRQAGGQMGINVLFHGDGGQSFFDFPNAGVQANPFAGDVTAGATAPGSNATAATAGKSTRQAVAASPQAASIGSAGLMGVALLAPDPNLRWGGTGRGLDRPDGETHSAAVNSLLTDVLPQMMDFDPAQVFMEGVSGGSLLLSGFMMPAFGASLGVPGAIFGCGGLPPQVNVQGDISQTRIHWQSTQNDLAELQQSIPVSIAAYEKLAANAGMSADQISQVQTADASPNGGHCEFDEKDFVSGVQLLSDNYSNILAGNGQLNGVKVDNGVVGNETLFKGNAAAAGVPAAAQGGAASSAQSGAAAAKAAGGTSTGAPAPAQQGGKKGVKAVLAQQ